MPRPPLSNSGAQTWMRDIKDSPPGDFRLHNTELHREDGPAFISFNTGQIRWIQFGSMQRDGVNPASLDRIEGSRAERWRITWPNGIATTVWPTNA